MDVVVAGGGVAGLDATVGVDDKAGELRLRDAGADSANTSRAGSPSTA
jgi:succinate dehydrogenase/fumarate reductase flavoprotein subunit